MRPEERDLAFIWDMWQAARDILELTDGMSFHAFSADKRTRLAVERLLVIIGEAARRVSDAQSSAQPDIPWHAIVGQRNVLVHEYGEVVVDRVWIVVREHIPDLVRALASVLEDHAEGATE